MLIALEGCDGTGKTTLAKALATMIDAEIIHCTTKTANTYEFFSHLIELADHKNIIADRWCYGQFVYQEPEDRPLKKGSQAAEYNLRRLENMMFEHNVKVVLVTVPEYVIEERLKERNETLINGLTVKEVMKRFEDLRRHSLLTWIEYTGGVVNV